MDATDANHQSNRWQSKYRARTVYEKNQFSKINTSSSCGTEGMERVNDRLLSPVVQEGPDRLVPLPGQQEK